MGIGSKKHKESFGAWIKVLEAEAEAEDSAFMAGSDSDQVEIGGGSQCQVSSSNCLTWPGSHRRRDREQGTQSSILPLCKFAKIPMNLHGSVVNF